jgi:hypothetical protein
MKRSWWELVDAMAAIRQRRSRIDKRRSARTRPMRPSVSRNAPSALLAGSGTPLLRSSLELQDTT